jgi:hypothetical protein
MGKKVRVGLFGFQKRSIMVDADATEGAVVGENLVDQDGNLVTLETIINVPVIDTRTVFPTLWQLILDIPAKLLGLLALTDTGFVYHENDVFSIGSAGVGATDWPVVKNSIGTGEEFTIPDGFQLLVWDQFTFEGVLTIDGDLVVI